MTDEIGRNLGEVPPTVFLPGRDEVAGAPLVDDRRPRSSESDTTAGALGAPSNRPGPR